MAAISVTAAVIAIWAARATRATASPPVLIFRATGAPPSARPTADPPPTSAEEDRALALAIGSISPAERARVLDLVRNTTARLETRLSPLGTDLGDDGEDPVKQLQKDVARYLPSLTAARELDRGHWRSADLTARAAESCADAAPLESCVPLWRATADSELERRARFLAWAATAAAIIELPSEEGRTESMRRLRERTAMPETTIALVLDRSALGFAPVAERDALKEAAHRLGRAMAANKRADRTDLESLGRTAPVGRSAPWLALGPRSVLLVPRLSASVRAEDFTREITAFATPFEWVTRPGGPADQRF